ncbi:MAG: ABC transporter ATP-binding protein [Vibrio sp.]
MREKDVLTITDLCTEFETDNGVVRVLDGVTFHVPKGKTVGLVGESGCGKSVTAMSILGLLPKPFGKVVSGSIHYHTADKSTDLATLPVEQMYQMRGNAISMIFQDPMTALNPVHTIGKQLMEVYQLHQPELKKPQRYQAALEMLEKVGIPSAKQRMLEFPHQLSGGMRQRVMIAIALACRPDVLICDEPTTALDVTVQAQILDLMKSLQQETGMSIIFITHDLGVVAEMCDQVVVMYAGKVVEQADVFALFDEPSHPYTQGLLASMPHSQSQAKTQLPTIDGSVPNLSNMPKGCRFAPRCAYRQELCQSQDPKLEVKQNEQQVDHLVSCHFWQDLQPQQSNR